MTSKSTTILYGCNKGFPGRLRSTSTAQLARAYSIYRSPWIRCTTRSLWKTLLHACILTWEGGVHVRPVRIWSTSTTCVLQHLSGRGFRFGHQPSYVSEYRNALLLCYFSRVGLQRAVVSQQRKSLFPPPSFPDDRRHPPEGQDGTYGDRGLSPLVPFLCRSSHGVIHAEKEARQGQDKL